MMEAFDTWGNQVIISNHAIGVVSGRVAGLKIIHVS